MAIVSTKSGFAAAAIFAASFGFTSLTQAAPIAGIPAVRMTQAPSAPDASPEKAYHHDEDYYYRKPKKHKYHHEYPYHHSDHHRYSYDDHRGHRHHPLHHVHRFLGHLLHDNHY